MGFAVLTVLTIAAVLLLSPYPPLQDFIEWIYQAEVLARLGDDGALPGVRLAGYPVPNSLFQLLLGGFALVMPAPAAGRLFLVAYAAAALLLAAGLARRYQPEAAAPFTCILLISFFFNAPFWNGYGNYQTGLLLLAGWYLLPEARRISPWLILAYGLLLFFAHAMVFAAFAAILGVEALARRRVLPTALALALPCCCSPGMCWARRRRRRRTSRGRSKKPRPWHSRPIPSPRSGRTISSSTPAAMRCCGRWSTRPGRR
ncbi:hypothetical protein ACFQU2_01250 [Siccirubricoccus deserti]